ncbi:ATP-binding cassette domain-containing protein, partial [Oleiphilus sp. HI0067]
MTTPIISVQDLSIAFEHNNVQQTVVHNVSFDVFKGKTLALVGESGSGKSVSTNAIMQ